MFSVLITLNVYTEYGLSSINCLHHLLQQIHLPRTASIPTEAAAKAELHKKKAQASNQHFCSISFPFLFPFLVIDLTYKNFSQKVFRLSLDILVLNQTPNQELTALESSVLTSCYPVPNTCSLYLDFCYPALLTQPVSEDDRCQKRKESSVSTGSCRSFQPAH